MAGAVIEIVVNDRVRVREADLTEATSAALRVQFEHGNPDYYKRKAMGVWAGKDCPREIVTWRREQVEGEEAWLTFPRGGMGRVREALRAEGREWSLVDERTSGVDLGSYTADWVEGKLFPPHRLTLWPHQRRIVDAFLHEREQGIARSPTGSGKSTALLALIAEANVPALIIVHAAKLLDQWQARIEAELGIGESAQGIVQGQRLTLRPITLAMQQTLARLTERKWETLRRSFGLVAVDETHRAAASTYLAAVDRFPARWRIGVSDDERRADRKEFLNYDLFGDVVVEIKRADLEAAGHIHEVRVRLVPTTYSADWYSDADANGEHPNFVRLVGEMANDAERTAMVVKLAAKLARQGATIVWSHRVEHCRVIAAALTAAGLKAGLMLGGEDGSAEFDRTKAGLRDGSVQVGVGTYAAIGVGQDFPEVTAGVCATPMHKSKQVVRQVAGRLCRTAPGKLGATLYSPWDRAVFGKEPVQNLRRWFGAVEVQDGEKWIPARRYLEEASHEAKRGGSDEVFGDAASERGGG